MSLLAEYYYPNSQGNDIWGWVSPDGSEYALVGLTDGFSVVNVTDPQNPTEEFFIADLNSDNSLNIFDLLYLIESF